MAAIVDVYSVKPFKTQWRIRVKILKKWKQYFDGVETMEMIVVDERNQVIHCTVKKEFIRRMDALFVEGETRIITNFTVSAASGRFRTSGHVYKIVLAQTTTIRTDLDLPPNVLGLHPVRFNDIHDGKLNPDFLIDVFGQIVEIGDVEILNVSKKQTKRLTMVLRDTDDVRLNCVLWGEFAEQLEAFAQNLHEAVVVFVLRFGKIRLYQNVWSVGNAYNCSIVMNNPDLPEVIAFRNRLPKDGVTLSYTHPNQLTIINSGSVREDFLTQSPRRTISEIVSASENVKCVTMATIMSIDTEYGWYYMQCQTCQKKVLPVDMEAVKEESPELDFSKKLWKCQKCEEYVHNVVPVFLLHFRVMDGTGETKFLLFDKLAMEVVNITAAELVDNFDEIQDPDVLPLALSNVCGKTMLFKVQIEKSNTIYNSDTFRVIKIVTRSDIVREFSETSASKDKTPENGKYIGVAGKDSKEIPLLILDSPGDEMTPSSKRKNDEDPQGSQLEAEHSSVKKPCLEEGRSNGNHHSELKAVKVEKTYPNFPSSK